MLTVGNTIVLLSYADRFRLGSGALNPDPRAKGSNTPQMALVPFILLYALICFAMVLLTWTALVCWQDMSANFEYEDPSKTKTSETKAKDLR